ncbi:Ligand-gated channel [Comamonas aquatilis]|uniref:TonB-dependent siderophore receptor n=1 Tax=Comamonas aquatilis TaxID=1778406 RepID=UPI0039EFEA32
MYLQKPQRPVRRVFAPTLLARAVHWVLCAGTVAALPLVGTAAHAQSVEQRSYDIPAGTLDAALRSAAGQAGVALIFTPEQTVGRNSAGLRGSYSVEGVFAALLKGSDWQAVRQSGGGWALRRVPQVSQAGAAAGETEMAPVTVTAAAERPVVAEGAYTPTGPVTTATRMGLTLRETPQSVSVVTRQLMDDMALTAVPDVLEKTPGITVGRNDSERYTFYSRGFTIENFQFDGVPNTMDSANQYTTSLADSAIYERVEVVKGATGLLTGAGNPSAVVNLVRKKPTKDFAASVELGAGSWNRYRSTVDVSGSLNATGSVRGRVVVAGQNAESNVNYYSRDTRNFYAIVEADLTPNTLLSLGFDYMQSKADGSTFGHLPLFYSDGSRTDFSRSVNPAARWSYWNNDSRNLFANLKHDFGGGWVLDASASHLTQSRDVVYGAAYNGTVNRLTGAGIRMIAGTIPTQTDANTFNAALSGKFQLLGRTHDVMLGAGYSRQHRAAQMSNTVWTNIPNYFAWDGNIAQPAFTRTSDRDIVVLEKGLSAATRLRPTEDLSVILGARASWYDMMDTTTVLATGKSSVGNDLQVNRKITPYAGLVYDLSPQWSLYGSVTNIFNPQTYYKDAGGNPLSPLTGLSKEVGVKGELLDGQLNASVALFHIKQKNAAQYQGLNGASGEEIYTAIDGITSRGLEAELSGSIAPGWSVFGGYTYRTSKAPAQPDVVTPAVNTNQPRHLLKLGTTYRLRGDWSRWTVGGNLTWQSQTYYQQPGAPYWRATQPSYAVAGLMARYELDKHWSMSINVNNLFDKTYMPGLGSYGSGVYGDPRNVLVTARYRF